MEAAERILRSGYKVRNLRWVTIIFSGNDSARCCFASSHRLEALSGRLMLAASYGIASATVANLSWSVVYLTATTSK